MTVTIGKSAIIKDSQWYWFLVIALENGNKKTSELSSSKQEFPLHFKIHVSHDKEVGTQEDYSKKFLKIKNKKFEPFLPMEKIKSELIKHDITHTITPKSSVLNIRENHNKTDLNAKQRAFTKEIYRQNIKQSGQP